MPVSTPSFAARRLAALVAMACGAAAVAQPVKLKPGLWEQQVSVATDDGKMESAMAQMQQRLAAMPPEQRKMVEAQLAKQGVGLGASGQTIKVCLSQADVDRDEFPRREGCTQNVQRSGGTIKLAFECKGPPPSSGTGEVTVQSPVAYKGDFNVRTEADGKARQTRVNQSGKWLAADCGGLKPITGR